jgi:MoxR-like ATPase
MFNIWVDYPSYEEEIDVVKATTAELAVDIQQVISSEEILHFQQLIRKIPVPDNVIEYAVNVASKTRPNTQMASAETNQYISWGAGPRASQFLIIGAKCHAAIHGKFSPDIEDVKAVATPILRHRIVRNYQAEADGVSVENLIASLL